MTALVVGGAALLVGLFFALRPDSEEPAATTRAATEPEPGTATTEPPTTEETATEETTTEQTTTAAPEIATLRVRVRGGRPAGGIQRLTVGRGERVRVRVESDVADHVHVHGYDLMRDVAPRSPAQIRFRATLVGRFEIELEDRGTLIAQLEVRP